MKYVIVCIPSGVIKGYYEDASGDMIYNITKNLFDSLFFNTIDEATKCIKDKLFREFPDEQEFDIVGVRIEYWDNESIVITRENK